MESIYEYGGRAGFWRLHRLFTRTGIPVTVFGVATALARSPEQAAAMKASNWEIASHGFKWIDYRKFPKHEELSNIQEAVRIHEEVTGTRPAGTVAAAQSIPSILLASWDALPTSLTLMPTTSRIGIVIKAVLS